MTQSKKSAIAKLKTPLLLKVVCHHANIAYTAPALAQYIHGIKEDSSPFKRLLDGKHNISKKTRASIFVKLARDASKSQLSDLEKLWDSILWDVLEVDINDQTKLAEIYKHFPLSLQKHVFEKQDLSGLKRRLPRTNEIPPIEHQYSLESFVFLIALSKEFIHKRYLQYQTVLEPALLRTLFVIWQFNPFSLISKELLSAIRDEHYEREDYSPSNSAIFTC
ncbi:hypothetical protein [Pseudoalteromonas luteoviolacea]|uniref:Uncharacterized protein n=1 Tax=Pseudoalteromonas luteoviolacea S4060-1 TaxID=1365257 RepID=A0A167JBE9_9GAMM|nr:hypothetical protein [Pseudoalteromonas luteoviolacea]KZN60862.1 hypothetical protein N478_26000 [Pseudoalteromonas luteoviolacea S4060-1]